MDQKRQDKARRCHACGGNRWWHSRTGWRICQRCYRDPLQALQVLADRVQGVFGPQIDAHDECLPQETMHEGTERRWEPSSLAHQPSRDRSIP
jgi:hypothetical protein